MASEEKDPKKGDEEIKFEPEEPVTKKHQATFGGKQFNYETTTGRLPIYAENERDIEAQMFYVAYTKSGVRDKSKRPVCFVFNGGPGSPAVWLHLGAVGPKRVDMGKEGRLPAPPYRLIANAHSWLPFTDLVLIDPIGTGYSRGKDLETSKKFWGVKGDIESVGEFIRLWLSRNDRWGSPLYLAGESYGTTRAAGLAGHLAEHGVGFKGIVLVSSILNFLTHRFVKGNDLPFAVFLPTYTATAHFHGKVKGSFQKRLQEAREFALGDYWLALAKGDSLDKKSRTAIRSRLSELSGLSETFCENANLRIHIMEFCKELLREDGRTVGRLDSRIRGIDKHRGADKIEHDPSMSELMSPYTAMWGQYARATLGYETDLKYEIFRGIKEPWDWGKAHEGLPDTSEALREAMSKNPHMKVLVASGYYDLATPFFATEYNISHMELDAEVRGNFEVKEYEAGHMMYIHEPSLKRFGEDVRKFVG